VDVSLDGTSIALDDADLFKLELTLFKPDADTPALYAGVPDSIGFSVDSGQLILAVVSKSGDNRSYLALASEISGANLEGLPTGLIISAPRLEVALNLASPSEAPLDWTNAIDLEFDATEFGADPVVIGGKTISFTARLEEVYGEVELDAFGFVTAAATFKMTIQTVDVSLDGGTTIALDDADLFTLELVLFDPDGVDGPKSAFFAGVPGSIGFSLDSGQMILATISKAGDDRSYLAFEAELVNAAMVGLPDDFMVEASLLVVQVNKAFGTGAEALDWASMVDLQADATSFGADPIVLAGRTLALSGALERVGGEVELNVFGFVTASAEFDFTRQQIDVDFNGDGHYSLADGDMDNASLITLFLRVTRVFVGVPDQGVGFELTTGTLAIAVIKSQDAGDDRSFMAVSASLTNAQLLGIEGVTVKARTLSLEINQASSSVEPNLPALDWQNQVGEFDASGFTSEAVVVSSADGTQELAIIFDESFLRVIADVSISIQGFVYVGGAVAFERLDDLYVTTVNSTASTRVSALTIAASNVRVFAGVGDPDSNNDGYFCFHALYLPNKGKILYNRFRLAGICLLLPA